jgi:hypothetical protein
MLADKITDAGDQKLINLKYMLRYMETKWLLRVPQQYDGDILYWLGKYDTGTTMPAWCDSKSGFCLAAVIAVRVPGNNAVDIVLPVLIVDRMVYFQLLRSLIQSYEHCRHNGATPPMCSVFFTIPTKVIMETNAGLLANVDL